jgi:hypothetical protein
MKYILNFIVRKLPQLPNRSFGSHWGGQQKKRKEWHIAVENFAMINRPKTPLIVCKLTLVRFAPRECDYDNMVYSFKPIVDGLVHSKIIADDRQKNIPIRNYYWVQVPKKDQHIEVTVEEI